MTAAHSRKMEGLLTVTLPLVIKRSHEFTPQ